MSNQLSDEQVENWRKIAYMIFGPYAGFMSREQLQMIRDMTQEGIERLPTQRAADEFCACDSEKQGKTIHIDGSVTCNKCGKTRR
jgi:hypothetical protein